MSKSFQLKNINILGLDIISNKAYEIIKYVCINLEILSGKYICVSNVHTIITAYDDKFYAKVQNSALFCLPDGGPLSSYGRTHGYPDMERITGPDLMDAILKISCEKGYKHFFYGSTTETLDKLKLKLSDKYKSLNIVGMYSPPFRALTEKEDEDVIDMINKAKPDFIWVGLGAPKQEIWMYNHMDKVHGLMVGVGAAFDYFAENIKRAPKWMQNHNLEWLYRLMQDPIRLLPRYLYTNTKFIFLVKILKK